MASSLAAIVVVSTFNSAFAQTPAPSSKTSVVTQSEEQPGVLAVVMAFLFGGSRKGYMNTLTLGRPSDEGDRHLCRYDRKNNSTVKVNAPPGTRFMVLSLKRGTAFFLLGRALHRLDLDTNALPKLPKGDMEQIALSPSQDLALLIGVSVVAPSRLLAVTEAGALVTIDLDDYSIHATDHVASRDVFHILANQSVAADGTVAKAGKPKEGVAQVQLLAQGEDTEEPQTILRLRDQAAPVMATEPRWSDNYRYLTYAVSCARSNCCPH